MIRPERIRLDGHGLLKQPGRVLLAILNPVGSFVGRRRQCRQVLERFRRARVTNRGILHPDIDCLLKQSPGGVQFADISADECQGFQCRRSGQVSQAERFVSDRKGGGSKRVGKGKLPAIPQGGGQSGKRRGRERMRGPRHVLPDRQRPAMQSLGSLQITTGPGVTREVAKRLGRIEVGWAHISFAGLEGPPVQWFGDRVVAPCILHAGQVVDDPRRRRIVGADGLLVDDERSPVERLRLGKKSKSCAGLREIVGRGGDIRSFRASGSRLDRECPTIHRINVVELGKLHHQLGQFVECLGRRRMTRSIGRLCQFERTIRHAQGFAVQTHCLEFMHPVGQHDPLCLQVFS